MNKPSILFVDDDSDLRQIMKLSLMALGARDCVLANSLAEIQSLGASALECNIALIDINLGVGAPNGIDVCEWLREQGFGGRILFLTGHGQDDPRVVAAARVSESSILSKPIGFEELKLVVDGAVKIQ